MSASLVLRRHGIEHRQLAPARIDSERIDLWWIALDAGPRQIDALRSRLSPEERAMSRRYRIGEGRIVVAWASRRFVLAEYLGANPSHLCFTRTSSGQPLLAGTFAGAISFSTSRSEECALIAVTARRAVGVDIERVRPEVDLKGVARCFFTAQEIEMLERAPRHLKPACFYRCWTRKEATLKAAGEGLCTGVGLGPNGHAFRRRWTVGDLHPQPGYAAALAVERRPAR